MRGRLTYHQAVRLGTTAQKGGRRPIIEDTDEDPPVEPTGPAEG